MPETLKLTVRRILDIYKALHMLDGAVISEFSAATRVKIMTNIVILGPVQEAHELVERAFGKQFEVYPGIEPTPGNALKAHNYNQACAEALDVVKEVILERITLKELLEKPGDGKAAPKFNAISQAALNRLTPILDFG